MNRKPARSLLDLESLSAGQLSYFFKHAARLRKPRPLLRDRRIALLFYEASTRTRVSFEFAAKSLGAHTAVVTASASSIEKGESLIDTGYTLQATGAECIVVRHPAAGAPHVLARHVDVPVINGGDGTHEHPTQGLLDAFTVLQHRRSLRGLRIAIVGDVLHSRVARSAVQAFTKLGARVVLCGPPALLPAEAAGLGAGVELTHDFAQALRGADVVMMLRIQQERIAGIQLDLSEYIARYQLTCERLRLAKKDALVMHPGPMLRGLEIEGGVADSPRSLIREQVANGLLIRRAVLAWALGAIR